MSNWSLIVPETTTNLEPNPSFETNTTGWSAGGTNTVAQSSAQSKFGIYSLKCTYQDDPNLARDSITLTAAAHTLSAWVYIPSDYDGTQVILKFYDFTDAVGTATANADMTLTDQWQRVSVPNYTIDAGDLAGQLILSESGAPTAGKYVYLDAVQCEALAYVTTYCDGDQPGCEWNGTEHAVTSTRSALEPTGGRVKDLYDDYSFRVSAMVGCGAIPLQTSIDSYAILPGGEINNIKEMPRPFTLVGTIEGTTLAAIHASRKSLLEALDPLRFGTGPAPVRLRYTGAAVDKEIDAYYTGGLEGDLQSRSPRMERVALQFEAPDPRWYQVGETAAVLDSNDSAAYKSVVAKLVSAGQWDTLGPPDAAGAYSSTYAIAIGPDKKIYIGGASINFDNIAAADYIVRYDPFTETFESIGGGLNNVVYALAFAPDGDTLYLGGSFTGAGGDGDADYFCQYSISGDAFSAVGIPEAGAAVISEVFAIVVDQVGDVYVGGDFLNFADVANADYIAKWDDSASSWVEVAASCNALIYTLAIDNANNVYIGGNFSNWGDANGDYIVMWDGSALNSLSTGANAAVRVIAVDKSNVVYIGGEFTTIGGVTANYIASWNGTTFAPLGSGMNNKVYEIALAPNNALFASGIFTTAGGISLSQSIAMWTGNAWVHLDATEVVGTAIWALTIGKADPVISSNFDIWAGIGVSGTLYYAGLATVTNSNNQNIQPRIIIERSGGTSATLKSVRNETTGKWLLFDYALLDGEKLIIDIAKQSIISDYWGSRQDAFLGGSDISDFVLQPGANAISCFIDVAGAPTITASLLWKGVYRLQD